MKRKLTSKCPVCDENMVEESVDYIEGTLMESYAACPKGCYYTHFWTGNYEEGFPKSDKQFYWSYKTPHQEVLAIKEKIKLEATVLKNET